MRAVHECGDISIVRNTSFRHIAGGSHEHDTGQTRPYSRTLIQQQQATHPLRALTTTTSPPLVPSTTLRCRRSTVMAVMGWFTRLKNLSVCFPWKADQVVSPTPLAVRKV